jgi:hypothetical protein
MLSTNADATHFVNCSGRIEMLDCFFENMNDDAINVHGNDAPVIKIVDTRSVEVRVSHYQQFGVNVYRAGDTVNVLEAGTLLTLRTLVVESSRLLDPERILLTFTTPIAGVLNLQNAMRRTIKVDDTVSGAGEGAPLCWRVAVSKWSNYVADSWDAVRRMSAEELAAHEAASKEKLVRESGAHYVIDDLRDFPAVVADVNERLARGENP